MILPILGVWGEQSPIDFSQILLKNRKKGQKSRFSGTPQISHFPRGGDFRKKVQKIATGSPPSPLKLSEGGVYQSVFRLCSRIWA